MLTLKMDTFQAFKVVLAYLLLVALPELHFTASDKPTSFSLKLVHRYSPESPLYPGILSSHERVQRYTKISESRASHLISITTNNKTMNPDMMHPSVIGDDFVYMVLVSIGTPRNNNWLLLDTGAGLIWIQCQPCQKCFDQNSTIFDPRKSTSYRKVPCENPLCKRFVCTNGECHYSIHYGDGSLTEGVASWETLGFISPDKTYTNVDVLFGCSYTNQGIKFDKRGNIAGILGLNLDPHSLISQLGSFIERRFSYCLVPPSPDGHSPPSYLKFGSDMGYRGGNVQTTPFALYPNSYVYGLNLLDISVNNKRLNYPPGTFKIKDNGEGGCFIDSGSVITLIEQDAYWKLHNEFVDYFARFQLERRTDCTFPIQLCYNLPAGFNSFPSMTYHFLRANLTIAPENVIIWQGKYFHLAVAPFKGVTVLGAWQQHNTRFTYDMNINSLSFVPENCSEDKG